MENQIQFVRNGNNPDAASYDIQISTAKRFPRNVTRAIENSIAIITLDKELAKSCFYSLPRGNKSIDGPSVHLARILAQNWGNIRVESRVSEIGQREIVSEAICFDLESNYATKVEVHRRIIDGRGQRYNDDMITVTGNAANAIAFRNAVFAVIPRGITNKVLKAAQEKALGDISSESAIIARRNEALKYFRDTYNATEQEILSILGRAEISQIRKPEIIRLQGLVQALRDGDTTPDEAFGRKSEKAKGKEKAANDIREKVKNAVKKQ